MIPTQIADLDTSKWILLPQEFTERPSLQIDPARLSHCPAVKKAGQELEINYRNTAKDSLRRRFIGNNDWKQSIMLPQFLGVKATTPLEELDYLRLLYSGSQNQIKVYDVSGKQIDSKLCEELLMDSIKKQPPWRANWVDAHYTMGEKGLEVHSNHVFDNQGNIIDYKSEVLDSNTSMKDRGISLDHSLNTRSLQDFPTKDTPEGNFYFWHPRNNAVAWFVADSDMAGLDCGRIPSIEYSSLGVRAAKIVVE